MSFDFVDIHLSSKLLYSTCHKNIFLAKMLAKDLSRFTPKELGEIENFEKGDSYFVPVFNFMYYLLICPFKVEKNYFGDDIDIGKQSFSPTYYTLKSYKVQKVGCIIIHIAAILQTFPFMYYYKDTFNSVDVSQLFGGVGNIACGAAVLVFIKNFWLDQTKILDFLNLSRIKHGLSERSISITVFFI